MTKWAGLAWDIGTCTVTTYVDGELVGQVSRYSGAGGAPYQVHSPYGFRSRPADPDSDGVGAQALYAIEGNEGHVWFLSDSRDDDKVPKLDKGGSVQHNALGSFGVLANKSDTKDGTYTLYIPVEFNGSGTPTKAHVVTVGKDPNGKANISIVHADGMAIVMDGDAKTVVIKSDDGLASIVLKHGGGIDIFGTKITVFGPLQIGGAGGLPVLVGTSPPGIPSTSLIAM